VKRRIAIYLALLAPLVTVPTAEAASRSVEAEVDYLLIKGQVKSPKARCEREAFVMLFRKGEDSQLQSRTTNRRGKFEFDNYAPVAGDYYVRVEKDPVRKCDAAKSNTVTVGSPRVLDEF
jgi:hypothetical protein